MPQRSSKQIYELLFETVTEGLIVADSHGRIELANQRAAAMFGYTVDELKLRTVDELLPAHMRQTHKQHRADYGDNPRPRPMGKGYDLIGVRKDGSSVPVEISLNHFSDNGAFKVMALVMDVTVRKEAEAQLKLLHHSLEKRVEQRTRELRESQMLYSLIARNFPKGTINVLDRDFRYVFVEGQELFRLGITSDRLMGHSYLERLPVELRPTMEEHLNAALRGEPLSIEVAHQDQHYLIHTAGLKVVDEITRILMVEQNITEQKQAEVKVREALEKEKQLNEMKSRFVSMASHEFRTPLSTVLSSLALIEKYDAANANPEKRSKHYKRIRTSVMHLTGILNDFLSLEKVEAGKVVVTAHAFDLRAQLQELVEEQGQLVKTGQKIEFTYGGHEQVNSDPNMLRIVVTNLLSNAIKYSFEGKTIHLEASADDKVIHLKVQDQGIGIPYEDQQNMFERFFRARNAINLEGTGLGLSIVNRYLQLLDGSISFESVPDEGTKFNIEIPNQQTT